MSDMNWEKTETCAPWSHTHFVIWCTNCANLTFNTVYTRFPPPFFLIPPTLILPGLLDLCQFTWSDMYLGFGLNKLYLENGRGLFILLYQV